MSGLVSDRGPTVKCATLATSARDLLDFGAAAKTKDGFGSLDQRGNVRDEVAPSTLITARMTYAFSLGAALGHPGAADLADHGVARLLDTFWDRRYGGFVVSLAGSAEANRKSAYELAFVLLAASTGVAAGIPQADELLLLAGENVEQRFWMDDSGAVRESWDRAFSTPEDYLGANSNMHMVEAMMAVADATGDATWLTRANVIGARFIDGYARAEGWLLCEHYAPDWTPIPTYNFDDPANEFRPYGVTIGHLFEWSRLLSDLAYAMDDSPRWLIPAANRLYETATRLGWRADGHDGFVYTVDWDGKPVVRTRPHWVLAEAIAAAETRAQRDGSSRDDADRWIAFANQRYVDRQYGSWYHELDPEGHPSFGIWAGKPDIYHALTAVLTPDYRAVGSMIGRILRSEPGMAS